MTRLHADQLPVHVLRRLGLDDNPARKPRHSRAGVGLTAPCPGHCGCGQPFPTALEWEKHATATGHTRWDIDLEETECS